MATGFPTSTQADWWSLVDKTTQRPREDLYFTTEDAIKIAPIYGAANRQLPALANNTPPTATRPLVAEADGDVAAGAIRAEVAGGAQQIALQLGGPGQRGLEWTNGTLAQALAGVDFCKVEVHLRPGLNSVGAAREFLSLIDTKHSAMGGFGLGADPIGAGALAGTKPCRQTIYDMAKLARHQMPRPSSPTAFLASGVVCHEAGGSPVQELAFALACAVTYLRALEQAGVAPPDGAALIALEQAAEADIFLTIAKFRAARHLWHQVLQGCGAPEAGDITGLAARISARMLCANDAHTNIVRATTAALGAGIGGVRAITILPFTHPLGEPSALGARIARNIPVILARESRIGAVRDAGAGAHYVESLTQELTLGAWSLFQEIEATGGIAAMIDQGEFQRQVAKVRAARNGAIARGEHQLTGVNIFPHLDERPPETRHRPDLKEGARDVVPLTPIRLDEPFSRLRQKSGVFLAATGARPWGFIANLGGSAELAAWCAQMLASGGIESHPPTEIATVEDAVAAFTSADTKIACICVADNNPGDLVPALVQALKRAGAKFVALVSDGEVGREAQTAAKVDAVVYRGSDRVAFLAEIHDAIGAGEGRK
ncbi:MAG: methylmalonyl-CoA mutase family protein [Alphaproteobacteria bacterium]